MSDRSNDRAQRLDTDGDIEQMNGEDEVGEIADHREQEVEEDVEKRLEQDW